MSLLRTLYVKIKTYKLYLIISLILIIVIVNLNSNKIIESNLFNVI